MSKNNLSVRQELAALYRILDMYGMTDLANQCAAARSSENKNIYLVHQVHSNKLVFLYSVSNFYIFHQYKAI